MEYIIKKFSGSPNKQELEINEKLNKLQSIVNDMNNHICLLRSKNEIIAEELLEIKILLTKYKIFPKKVEQDDNYYFYERSQSTDFEDSEV